LPKATSISGNKAKNIKVNIQIFGVKIPVIGDKIHGLPLKKSL